MRFAHLLFRAWVDQVSNEVVHDTPSDGVMKAVVSSSPQSAAGSDDAAGEAAPITPPSDGSATSHYALAAGTATSCVLSSFTSSAPSAIGVARCLKPQCPQGFGGGVRVFVSAGCVAFSWTVETGRECTVLEATSRFDFGIMRGRQRFKQ